MRHARIAARAAGLGLLAAAAATVAAPSSLIDCSTTPFGKTNRMLQDVEFLELRTDFGANSTGRIDEYRLPFAGEAGPLTGLYNSALTPAGSAVADGTLGAVASVDLNGDGREEIVAAFRVGNIVKLAVYKRQDGFQPSAVLLDTWSSGEASSLADTIDLVAGDFDGSRDGKQEVAALWRTGDSKAHVVVLTGAADGSLVQADNTVAGGWRSADAMSGQVTLTRGDFLLDGRDQLVVVSNGTAGTFNDPALRYDLLEYQSTQPDLTAAAGSTNIAGKRLVSVLASGFRDDPQLVNFSQNGYVSLGTIDRLRADGGDVADSAAAELVLHVLFHTAQNDYFLGQRLLHFDVAPMPAGTIALGTSAPLTAQDTERDFDASQVLNPRQGNYNSPTGWNSRPNFAAAVAEMDGQGPAEIVVFVAPTGQFGMGEPQQVRVYSSGLKAKARFQFTALGATPNHYPVHFANNATGDIVSQSWDFGDGQTSTAYSPPDHVYTSAGTKTVTLTVTDAANRQASYSQGVTVGGPTLSSGGERATYSYSLGADPDYVGSMPINSPLNVAQNDLLSLAVGDMNRDGAAEILLSDSIANQQQVVRELWRLDTSTAPPTLSVAQQSEARSGIVDGFAVVASDFDGDNTRAVLTTDPSKCRSVSEKQLRNLIWLPPYFSALQAPGDVSASFGTSSTSGSSTETRSGMYTSHDISGYLGYSIGTPETSAVQVRGTLKVTAGHNWQSGREAVHSDENERTLSEGASVSGDQGDALLTSENVSANCYAYDVMRSGTAIPDSAMRMCEVTGDTRGNSNAGEWNDPRDGNLPAAQPSSWIPAQRDWASMALFRLPTSNSSFGANAGADKATDGLFSTATSGNERTEPYLELDLGDQRDVAAIRIFPAANRTGGVLDTPLSFTKAAVNLAGFRVYASATPFAGAAVPTGAGVSVYAPGLVGDAVYDRWSILTRDSQDPSNPLRARYIRLQHPGASLAVLRVAEIQVFGAAHVEPPAFPEAVCDSAGGDGYFLAKVWDKQAVPAQFRNIEVRGDLLWSGANLQNGSTGIAGCGNHAGVPSNGIWQGLEIGGGAASNWNLNTSSGGSNGNASSFDSSTRVGAEFDFEIGNLIQQAVTGVAYEFTTGITRSTQSTSYWSSGLDVGGEVNGFTQPGLVNTCKYVTQPYAFHLIERGNASYQHDVYVADYVVHEALAWTRANVSALCTGTDVIFADGFQ